MTFIIHFKDGHRESYSNHYDENDEHERYNVKGLPTILLLNDKEEVLETWHGIVKSEVINSKIKEYETN